jgi:acetyl esterase/lipase
MLGYLLSASTVLAFVDGDLDSAGGAAGAGVALLALAGLVLVVYRATLAHAALHNSGRPRRPWGRILRAPFFPGRRDVVRVRGRAYGDGPRRTLDVYHRRDRPTGVRILLHFHGGGFHSGNKAREARPLIQHLTSRRGFVCVSANYRLQPDVTLADQVADVREAIAWVRAHAAEYGGDPGSLFVTGSSAGAYLAIQAACEGETGIAGLICRYGYHGNLTPRGDMPPTLVVHGEKDILVPASAARAFAERVRTVSSHPVTYAELPGAHHDFDMFESIRSAAVNEAVDAFTAGID